MREWCWHRIDPGEDPQGALKEALLFFPTLCNELFTILRPELHVADPRISSMRFHEGARVRDGAALNVLAYLLEDRGFRCELISDAAHVIGVGDAVYVGLEQAATVPDLGGARYVERASPPIQDWGTSALAPADAKFWAQVVDRIRQAGELLLLDQWAGGIGGERWTRVTATEQLSIVRGRLVPRSIIAVFPRSTYVDVSRRDAVRAMATSEEYSAMRWLTPQAEGYEYRPAYVNDGNDLTERLNAAEGRELLFLWPEDECVALWAACADPDGVVRATLACD